jgi:hypothetical protein
VVISWHPSYHKTLLINTLRITAQLDYQRCNHSGTQTLELQPQSSGEEKRKCLRKRKRLFKKEKKL